MPGPLAFVVYLFVAETVSSLLVSFAFAIGPSLLVLVNSVVFLFVQHPFDVGDRVVIDGENVVRGHGLGWGRGAGRGATKTGVGMAEGGVMDRV